MDNFKELYRIHSKELFNYLLYLTNDYSLAEELLQETFFQAFTAIHRFKGKSKVRTWLYQIAKYVYYNHQKKNRFQKVSIDDNEEKLVSHITPDMILMEKEDNELLYSSLKQLKEPYKQVIILRSYSELSFKEIGEIFSKSENWARVTFHRGKIQLLQLLKKGGM